MKTLGDQKGWGGGVYAQSGSHSEWGRWKVVGSRRLRLGGHKINCLIELINDWILIEIFNVIDFIHDWLYVLN